MDASSDDFAARLAAVAAATEAMLASLLGDTPAIGEIARPPRLLAAMRHAALGGGKRLRPFLLVECAALFGAAREGALLAGCALECVHCYSLVHDDLPAMDDDDLRRGQPTVHKAFDEATAILAGDALLTFAFDLMARPAVHPDAGVRVALVSELARAAGFGGMAGGQMLDLEAEGRFKTSPRSAEGDIVDLAGDEDRRAHCVSPAAPAPCSAAPIRRRVSASTATARAIGKAFQIADDLLDVEGSAGTIGKATGKDAAAGKATLVAALGVKGARARLDALVAEADATLAPFAAKADSLRAAARFIAERRN